MYHKVKMQELHFIFQECSDTAEVLCWALALLSLCTGMFFYQIKECLARCAIFKRRFRVAFRKKPTLGSHQALDSTRNNSTIKTLDMFIEALILAH